MAYGDFKDLPEGIASDEVLCNKPSTLLKVQKMIRIKEVLLQWFKNF